MHLLCVNAVSFPKSGRSWIQLMVAKIYSELTDNPISTILNDEHPKYHNIFSGQKMPHVFFSHGHHNGKICQGGYFPKAYYQNKRVFLLVRDPRDVVVSHYYYEKWHYEAFSSNLSDFLRYPFQSVGWKSRKSRYGIRPIINYMNAWAANISLFKDIYVAHYEDFKEDVDNQLRILVDYIGINPGDDVLAEAIDYGSFDNMRKLEQTGSLDWHGLEGSEDERGLKVRKGIVGGSKEELNRSDIEFVNKEISDNLDSFFERYKLY